MGVNEILILCFGVIPQSVTVIKNFDVPRTIMPGVTVIISCVSK